MLTYYLIIIYYDIIIIMYIIILIICKFTCAFKLSEKFLYKHNIKIKDIFILYNEDII